MVINMDNLSAFERGEYDALMGFECRTDECESYYSGYSTQYAQLENATAHYVEHIKLTGDQYDN